jgi:putative transposase
MKRRYTEEQIIKAIKEHESGVKVDDICRSLSISFGTFYNWRSKFAGLEVNEAKRLRELEAENGKFRNECLNRHWFRTMQEEKLEVMQWQYQYNNVRPHSSLNYLPPVALAEKAKKFLPSRHIWMYEMSRRKTRAHLQRPSAQ